MNIPEHVCAALGCATEIDSDALAAVIDDSEFVQGVFGLSGQEFVEAANLALDGGADQFDKADTTRLTQVWRYLEFSRAGGAVCTAVLTATETDNNGVEKKPPTAAAKVLAAAWFFYPEIVEDSGIRPKIVIVYSAKNGVLPKFPSRLVYEWTQVCPLFDGIAVKPVWITKSQVGVAMDAKINGMPNLALRFEDLFLEAVSEVKVKWRFLSIYRVLEHGYLSEVFRTLESEFFSSPKESLAVATDSLESEIKQFISLVNAADLKNEFEIFCDQFEAIKANNNRFAYAIDKSMQQGGQTKIATNKWQKGVVIFYKIRCAVVHAGMTSPMYDALPDGGDCLEALLPTCEHLILKYLGVTVA